jgi:hypothetical protein
MSSIKKSSKTFKDYYKDPKFRERHLNYMSEKVKCKDCGRITSRCNMSKHRGTEIHNRLAKEKILNEKKSPEELREHASQEIELLTEYLDLLHQKLKLLDELNKL